MRLGHAEKVWPAFITSKDDSLRSYLVHWCPRDGVDSQLVLADGRRRPTPARGPACCCCWENSARAACPPEQRRPFAGQVAAVFETDADAGLHAAAGWLLRQWKCGKIVDAAVKRLAKKEPQRCANDEYRKRRWYVNSEGQTYVVVDAQQPFQMGSPASEHGPDVTGETQHLETVGRRFAIAATPVTVEQFRGYLANNPDEAATTRSESPGSADAPKTDVMWFQAVKYCNWLSAKDEIPKDQWCYEPNKDDKFADGMTVKEDYVKLTGYRLPTEAEWEFACLRRNDYAILFRRGRSTFARVRSLSRQQRSPRLAGGRSEAERPWPVRHAWQRLAVVRMATGAVPEIKRCGPRRSRKGRKGQLEHSGSLAGRRIQQPVGVPPRRVPLSPVSQLPRAPSRLSARTNDCSSEGVNHALTPVPLRRSCASVSSTSLPFNMPIVTASTRPLPRT